MGLRVARPAGCFARRNRRSQCLIDRDDILSRMGEITGADDHRLRHRRCPAIGMDRAEILAKGLSGCRALVRVEGGAHAANYTHADQVNGPLLDFLRSLR